MSGARVWLRVAGASLLALACSSDRDQLPIGADAGDAPAHVGPAPYEPPPRPPAVDAAVPEAARDSDGPAAPDVPAEASPEVGPEMASSACGRTGMVHSHGVAILDAFPLAHAILVVRRDALLLVGRDGEIQKMVPAPREITAVALASPMAGPLLVADRAMLVTYSLDLVETGRALLTEECRAAALVEGRLVCGPSGDYGGAFFVYDVAPPRLVARTAGYLSYGSGQLRAVPGTPYLLVGGSLYKLHADGQVKAVNSGYSSSSNFGQVAFFGRPATHAINQSGELYKILGQGCDGATTTPPPACLVREGAVGTLPTGRSYAAMATDDAGATLLGLIPLGNSYDRINMVTIQRSDIARRVLLGEKSHTLPISAAFSLRADPTCDRVVLITRSGEERPYDPNSRATYTVVQLD